MTAFIIRRLLYTIPIVFGVLLLTFVLFTLLGGDISYQIAGRDADAETIAEIRHEYGLDKPLFVGLEPLDEDDWQGHKEAYLKQAREAEEGRLKESTAGPARPLSEFELEQEGQKIWLRDLFKERLGGLHLVQAWRMLDFDSQFFSHFTKALTFNFGYDLNRELIADRIRWGVGPSLALTVPMFIGTVTISIALALVVAFVRGSKLDMILVVICVAGMSIPYLSFIIFGQYFFAYRLDWFPIFFVPDRSIWVRVALPVLIGIAAGLGANLRFYRTVMLDEMQSDYVRTAFAKGLSTRTVLFKHVLKNAMIPIITNVVLSIPYLILCSLLLERFFGIPGLGDLMIQAINSRDFFVLNAMTYIMSLLIVIFTLLTDICYAWVDPRVSLE